VRSTIIFLFEDTKKAYTCVHIYIAQEFPDWFVEHIKARAGTDPELTKMHPQAPKDPRARQWKVYDDEDLLAYSECREQGLSEEITGDPSAILDSAAMNPFQRTLPPLPSSSTQPEPRGIERYFKPAPSGDNPQEAAAPASSQQAASQGTSQQASSTGTSQQAPSVGTSQQAPSVGTSQGAASSTGTSQQAPAVGTSPDASKHFNGISKQAPAVGTSQQAPSVGTSQQAPSSQGTSQQAPSVGTPQQAPSSQGTSQQAPSVGTSQQAPSTGTSQQAPPQGTSQEAASKGTSQEAASSTGTSQQAPPQGTSQDASKHSKGTSILDEPIDLAPSRAAPTVVLPEATAPGDSKKPAPTGNLVQAPQPTVAAVQQPVSARGGGSGARAGSAQETPTGKRVAVDSQSGGKATKLKKKDHHQSCMKADGRLDKSVVYSWLKTVGHEVQEGKLWQAKAKVARGGASLAALIEEGVQSVDKSLEHVRLLISCQDTPAEIDTAMLQCKDARSQLNHDVAKAKRQINEKDQ